MDGCCLFYFVLAVVGMMKVGRTHRSGSREGGLPEWRGFVGRKVKPFFGLFFNSAQKCSFYDSSWLASKKRTPCPPLKRQDRCQTDLSISVWRMVLPHYPSRVVYGFVLACGGYSC